MKYRIKILRTVENERMTAALQRMFTPLDVKHIGPHIIIKTDDQRTYEVAKKSLEVKP